MSVEGKDVGPGTLESGPEPFLPYALGVQFFLLCGVTVILALKGIAEFMLQLKTHPLYSFTIGQKRQN